MKAKLIIILILFFSIISSAQTKQLSQENNIRKALNSFVDQMKNKNIDNAVEFIYPKYFKVVPKDQMKQILNLTYNNPALDIKILEFKIANIEKPEKINNELFSLTNYTLKMNLKIDWLSIPNGQKMKSQINEGLYKKFGKDNVKYISSGDYYLINSEMIACAVSNNGKEWKFLILDEGYKPQLINILPKKIFEKI